MNPPLSKSAPDVAVSALQIISKETVIHKYITLQSNDAVIFIELKAHSDGFVYWCSAWEHIQDLQKLGIVTSKPEPMHHRDYYLPVELLVIGDEPGIRWKLT